MTTPSLGFSQKCCDNTGSAGHNMGAVVKGVFSLAKASSAMRFQTRHLGAFEEGHEGGTELKP